MKMNNVVKSSMAVVAVAAAVAPVAQAAASKVDVGRSYVVKHRTELNRKPGSGLVDNVRAGTKAKVVAVSGSGKYAKVVIKAERRSETGWVLAKELSR